MKFKIVFIDFCLTGALFYFFIYPLFFNEKNSFYDTSYKEFFFEGRFFKASENSLKAWAPGATIRFGFNGNSCVISIEDESFSGIHNYIQVKIDDLPLRRIKLKNKYNILDLSKGLSYGKHRIEIVKCTEAALGFIAFKGVWCKSLFALKKKKRVIEFIGDSISCGNGAHCFGGVVKGDWYDQHDAYLSYGLRTARLLNASVSINAISGIGVVKSCCGTPFVMSDCYPFTDLSFMSIPFYSDTKPDLVVVCLGQNDGFQDSSLFTNSLMHFLNAIRNENPKTFILLLTSPMASSDLKFYLERCNREVVKKMERSGDSKCAFFSFSKRFFNGRGLHPNVYEHKEMANELTSFIRTKLNW